MKWILTIFCGILATLSMDVAMNGMMSMLGLMPTNIHPAAAFLYNLGVESEALTRLLHFSYGTLWALVFIYAFAEDASLKKAMLLAGVLWLFMMLVYSPIIGWGFFGYGDARLLHAEHPLYLRSAMSYILLTFMVHAAYGLGLGFSTQWLVPKKAGQNKAK